MTSHLPKGKKKPMPEIKVCCEECSPEYIDGKPSCNCECHEQSTNQEEVKGEGNHE